VEFLVGALLAFAVGLSATCVGFDRDRAFNPTVLVVIASYYALFVLLGGSVRVLVTELIVIAAFLGASFAGFKQSFWLVVVAFAAQGVFDSIHGHLIANMGVPPWWPGFCLAYDSVAAAYLASLLLRSKVRAAAT